MGKEQYRYKQGHGLQFLLSNSSTLTKKKYLILITIVGDTFKKKSFYECRLTVQVPFSIILHCYNSIDFCMFNFNLLRIAKPYFADN